MENQIAEELKPEDEIKELGNLELEDDIDYDTLKEKYGKAIKTSQTLFAQKNHFKGKFEKANEKPLETPEEIKKDTVVKNDDENKKLIDTVGKLSVAEDKRTFGHENSLSPEETNYVFQFAGDKDPKEVLENPFVKAGLQALRSEEKVKNATPGAGPSSGAYVPSKDGKDATSADKQANFEKFMSKKLGNG